MLSIYLTDPQALLKLEMSQTHSYLTVGAQAELARLQRGVDFISDRINYPHLTPTDLTKTVANRLNKRKPSASSVKSALFDGIYYNNLTHEHHTGFLAQRNFLQRLQAELQQPGAAAAVIEELYEMISLLAQPQQSFLYVAASAPALVKSYGPDIKLFAGIFNQTKESTGSAAELAQRFAVVREHQYRGDLQRRHVALGLDSTKSCYLSQSVLYNNTNWAAREVGQVRVMLKYLSDRLYHSVRGAGLTYSVSMSLSVSTGRVVLGLSKSSQLVAAYRAVRDILSQAAGGEDGFWQEGLAQSAKGALIYSWAEKEETISGLVSETVKVSLGPRL